VHIHPEFTDQHPYVWTHVHIEYLVTGKVVESYAVERALVFSSTKYCPAQNMRHDSVEIESTYKTIEAIQLPPEFAG
jgi:putative redox protein